MRVYTLCCDDVPVFVGLESLRMPAAFVNPAALGGWVGFSIIVPLGGLRRPPMRLFYFYFMTGNVLVICVWYWCVYNDFLLGRIVEV